MKVSFRKLSTRLCSIGVVFFLAETLFAAALTDIETAVLQEDYPQVEKLAQEFIASKPLKKDFDEALYYLGLSRLRLEHYQEARDTFHLLMSGFPRETLRDKAYLGYIDSLYLEGQYPGAIKVAEELLGKSPRSEFLSLAYLKLARANLKLGQWKKAEEYLKKVIAEFPDSLEAHTANQLLEEKQYFAVQVGAFLDQQRAEKLVSDLAQKGEYAYIVETTDRQERKFYRVRIGKLTVLEEAKKLEAKLAQLGYPTAIYP